MSSEERHFSCKRRQCHKSIPQDPGLSKPETKLVSPEMKHGELCFMDTSGPQEGG